VDSAEQEDQELRTAVLKNAESILIARRRAEQALLEAHEALERRTEELQQQREWFQVTLSSLGDAVITTNVRAEVTYLNPVAETLTGWTLSEAAGQPIETVFKVINEDTGSPAPSPVDRMLNEGVVLDLALHVALVRRDGRITAIEDSAAPIRDACGNLIGAVMVFHDVTSRREAERALRRSEQLLTDFFENAAVGLHWVSSEGIILRANRTELNLLGYSREEYVGRHIAEFHADKPVIDDILQRLSCGECLEAYEARLRCKDGSIKYVLISSNVLWEDGKFIHTRCFTRDITDRKLAEMGLREEFARRERAEAALRETDRRKDEFLATLAHELRNPLAPIRQAALISQARNATDAQKRWSHAVIDRQMQHMARLLDDLLDISRITRGVLELRLEATELNDLIDAAVETARPLIDAKRHTLSVERSAAPSTFMADPMRMAQVLSNLLTNAAKYTDAGGEILLRAEVTDETILLRVKDNGIGIPAAALSSVFEMFAQVKSAQDRSEGGLGIGLALAKGIVDLHGGKIEVKSEGPGQGSEFIVGLPCRQAPFNLRGSLEVRPAAPITGRRVLIADDNVDGAESLGILLRMEGHEVLIVHNGRAAIEAFSTFEPEVAFLDIGMPQVNGYEVARSVRQEASGRAVTLIAISGWGKDTDKQRALAAGFDHHFTKPVHEKDLMQVLREHSDSG
jgi:PAS domain S-box-containing protein